MHDYQWLYEYCLNRFGSDGALQEHLPHPQPPEILRQLSDACYLSTMSRRIFQAGLKHSVVDGKWPVFEEVFFGFDPEKMVLLGEVQLERLMQDRRLIRHLGKLKSIPINAQLILDTRREQGGFGRLIADWPVSDIVGLWRYLAGRGSQLGGLSAPRFLRMVGKDTFVLTRDVIAALKAQGVIDRPPTSQRDLATVQAVFNRWHEQSNGRPLCHLSMMLACTVNH